MAKKLYVYVVKYALTRGIYRAEVEMMLGHIGNRVADPRKARRVHVKDMFCSLGLKEFDFTKEDAERKARILARAEANRLRKQLKKVVQLAAAPRFTREVKPRLGLRNARSTFVPVTE